MKRSILLLALLFATAFSAFAQIEEEIQQSKKEKIEKGRAYLLEKFLDRDYDKVKEVKDYLIDLEDDNYAALAPVELWHILFWTKEYDALTAAMRQVDSVRLKAFSEKIKPQRDALGKQLSRRCIEDEHLVRFNLQEAQLSAEDKDFLTLFLDWDLKPYSHENQKQWNEKSDKFLADYPNSDYEWFVRHFIRVVVDDSDWGWGMGINLCGGFLTGELKKKIQPIFGLGLNIDVVYKKILLSLGYDIIISDTKIDQPYSGGIYPAGSRDNVMNFYANLAYPVVANRAISIAPFVGIGGAWDTYGYGQYDKPNLSELDKFYTTCQAGLIFDVVTHGAFEGGVIRKNTIVALHPSMVVFQPSM